WLLTYSDLITLLMVFFVIMYAMSNVDAEKYQRLSTSLSSAFLSEEQLAEVLSEADADSETQTESEIPAEKADDEQGNTDAQDLEAVAAEVKKMLKEKSLEADVSVSIAERGVVISLTNTVVFESGKADIKPNFRSLLAQLGATVKDVDNYIRIEGNTDNVPMNSAQFASNWELSVARATQVVRLLINDSGVNPQKISAIGYGEYRPKVPNDTPEHRAQNRRVDIVLLRDTYDIGESEMLEQASGSATTAGGGTSTETSPAEPGTEGEEPAAEH
ncbi:MAG: OmpA family protein, partial [Eubacteriales bacterium]|nr:OmpA family protein [Eubacteriales bacterium]